jgi:lipoate-protein ligase A
VSKKLLFALSFFLLTVLTGAKLTSEAPYDDATALLDEYVVNLEELYTRGASPDEVRGMTATYEAELTQLFSELSPDEQRAFKTLTEERIAGELWGMGR